MVVLQMTMQVPVYKREIMNHMYTPTAYYFARALSGMLLQLSYPLIQVAILFFGLGFPITLSNFINFLTAAFQIVLVGSSLGFLAGVMTDDDIVARSFCTFTSLIFTLTSGALNSAANYPPVIE